MKEIGARPGEHPHPLHWAEIRRLALQRDRGCRTCGDTDGLEVHHRTYERFGGEILEDVTVLCRGCHDLITGAMMRLRDERRNLPIDRTSVEVERFAATPLVAQPAPLRAPPEIERFFSRPVADLPPPSRNVR